LVEHILAVLRILLSDAFKYHREAAKNTYKQSPHSYITKFFYRIFDFKKKRKINKNIVVEQTAFDFLFAFLTLLILIFYLKGYVLAGKNSLFFCK